MKFQEWWEGHRIQSTGLPDIIKLVFEEIVMEAWYSAYTNGYKDAVDYCSNELGNQFEKTFKEAIKKLKV